MTARSLLELDLSYLTDLEALLRDVSNGPSTINTNHERQMHRAATRQKVASDESKQQHQQAQAELQTQLQANLQALQTETQERLKRAAGRRRIKRDSILDNQEIVQSQAAEMAGHDEWLAESMYEAGTQQAEEALRICTIHDDSVQTRAQEAIEHLASIGYTHQPTDTPAPASMDEPEIEQLLDTMDVLIESLQEPMWVRACRRISAWFAAPVGLMLGWALTALTHWTGPLFWASLSGGAVSGLLVIAIAWFIRRSQIHNKLHDIATMATTASTASTQRK